MKKLIALGLAVVSFSVMATDWNEIYKDDDGTRYVDFDSIKGKSNTPILWIKQEYNTPRVSGVRSVIVKTQFNCAKETYRTLVGAVYDSNGNQLGRVDSGVETTIIPETMAAIDMEFACSVFRKP